MKKSLCTLMLPLPLLLLLLLVLVCASACGRGSGARPTGHPPSGGGEPSRETPETGLSGSEMDSVIAANDGSTLQLISLVVKLGSTRPGPDSAELARELDSRLRVRCDETCHINEK